MEISQKGGAAAFQLSLPLANMPAKALLNDAAPASTNPLPRDLQVRQLTQLLSSPPRPARAGEETLQMQIQR
jgi:hypothetical protein